MIIFVFDRVENIVGIGECWLPAFSPFPTMFGKVFLPRHVKRCHCVGVGEEKCRILSSGEDLILYHTIPTFYDLEKETF